MDFVYHRPGISLACSNPFQLSVLVGVSIERVVSSATRKEIFNVFEWNPDLPFYPLALKDNV